MIDRIFIAILLLSISGFVFCFVFLLLESLVYRHTSAKTMVMFNTIALLSFVFPLYFIVSLIDGSELTFQTYNTIVLQNTGGYEDAIIAVRKMHFTEYVSDIWFFVTVCTLLCRTGKFFYTLYGLTANSFALDDDVWSIRFEELKQEKNVKNVSLVGSCRITTPCTFGIGKRYIAIPAAMLSDFEKDEVDLILQHEFYHVIHRDLLRKFLIMLLSCVHWFNPLFYLLKENLAAWQETACDEEVMKNFGKDGAGRYIRLYVKILEVQSKEQDAKNVSYSFIGNHLNGYKRRIIQIMRKSDKTSFRGKIAVASVTLLSIFSGNVVAKAADVPMNQIFSPNVTVMEASAIRTVDKIESLPVEALELAGYGGLDGFVKVELCDTEDTTYKIIYEGSDKTFTEIDSQAEPRHAHQLVDTIIEEHKKNSDGSCKTTYYKGKKCTGCGQLWESEVLSEMTFKKCPH